MEVEDAVEVRVISKIRWPPAEGRTMSSRPPFSRTRLRAAPTRTPSALKSRNAVCVRSTTRRVTSADERASITWARSARGRVGIDFAVRRQDATVRRRASNIDEQRLIVSSQSIHVRRLLQAESLASASYSSSARIAVMAASSLSSSWIACWISARSIIRLMFDAAGITTRRLPPTRSPDCTTWNRSLTPALSR